MLNLKQQNTINSTLTMNITLKLNSTHARLHLKSKRSNQMKDFLEVLRSEMKAAQTKYEDDTNRNCLSASTMKTGDEIWIDARNIQTKRSARKLDWKNLDKFNIKIVLSFWTYELELSVTMNINFVFHVLKLNSMFID